MKFRYFLILSIILNSCNSFQKDKKADNFPFIDSSSFNEIATKAFEKRGIDGCFILRDLQKGEDFVFNKKRSTEAFLPASTYKILNSLIALECEVIQDENETIPWDSVERSISVWNQDHNMKSGIKYSVVWFYQELARRIGTERMQFWIDQVEYGNREIGKTIDTFWLTGDLRISPLEQVSFLESFVNEKLPFSKEHIATVNQIMVEDAKDEYVLRGKTGWANYGTPVGWYVGYLDINGSNFIFVNNLEIWSDEDAKARKAITREILDSIFEIELEI